MSRIYEAMIKNIPEKGRGFKKSTILRWVLIAIEHAGSD